MTGIVSYKIDFSEIKLDKKEISSFMGLGPNPDEPFNSMIDEAIALLSKNKNIEGGYVIKPVTDFSIKDGSISVEEKSFNTGRMITSFLKGSEYVALFICTAGYEVEKWSKKFQTEGDFVMSFVVDATGSLLVEGAMDIVYNNIKDYVENDTLSVTNRYSPGYCDWKVIDQQKLFSFLPDNFCKVKLSESSLMSPVKSVSGIVGIGKKVTHREYICDTCSSTDCVYRAKKMYVRH
ncbi:vitamin B12 dependent-methionine synthase activation domain-containing protein [Namhaeicola litoreus]|uniref:Vitamin B12 dependent-methionine synthase activation domain-containing protein n=1 Tax=Namhaeicola litoreus TaxID=1052145 RepID=A0ABW3Y3T6_9FLAO